MNDDDLRLLHGSLTPCGVLAPLSPGVPGRRIAEPVFGLRPDRFAAAALGAGGFQPPVGSHR
jgi:hypothetical protein